MNIVPYLFFKQIADIAGFGSSKRLYMMDVQLPAITTGLILAHAQSLATIQAWCQWLFQLHKLSALGESLRGRVQEPDVENYGLGFSRTKGRVHRPSPDQVTRSFSSTFSR